MGGLESKRWIELMPETPQKENAKENLGHSQIEDPRSPSMHHKRTPIVLQEYKESPQNIALRAEFYDPRSPSVKVSRTPLTFLSKSVVIVDEKDGEDVFESRERSTSDPPTANSKHVSETEVNSPGAPLTRKDKVSLLKSTASPCDFKRKNRLRRRQSLPQKLFTDKSATIPRSPLAQRNHSLPEDGKNRFTLLPKKKGFISEDFNEDKENTHLPIVH
ncbi:uncharacterized protein LOC116291429 [Actinia tenebrosa]|uniref:Uncharacterized protein LOC116291429 n=1 Tax=Actinia tenebrosa TaxID=6105 RepID=A0A6P8HPA7_ACTTE|nr:uncharacterized protein LOC116291429 [Actinia tenebrosa]